MIVSATNIYSYSHSDTERLLDCNGTSAEKVIEYAARLCYNSTINAGRSSTFIGKLIERGHMDVIEHGWATLLLPEVSPEQARMIRYRVPWLHFSVTFAGMVVSGNLRAWRMATIERNDLPWHFTPAYHDLIDDLSAIAPSVFGGRDGVNRYHSDPISDFSLAASSGQAVVTMLASNMPPAGYVTKDCHYSFTFLIENVSRALTHQLVRHRLGSFSQESQRYVRNRYRTPIGTPNIPEKLYNLYYGVWENAMDVYDQLIEGGVKREDARMILPNFTPTRIIVTMNMLGWRHFIGLRSDKAAQWEIRGVSDTISEMLAGVGMNVGRR